MDAERLVRPAAVVDMVAGLAGDDDAGAVALPSRTWSSVAGRGLCMLFRARADRVMTMRAWLSVGAPF
jgi:hypothetical protein